MNERQAQHDAALCDNVWTRANYGVEEDVRGNEQKGGGMHWGLTGLTLLSVVALACLAIGAIKEWGRH